MKTISTGGKIVGVLELLIGAAMLAHYVWAYDNINMDRVLDNLEDLFPVICLVSGIFKIIGVVIIWFKQKFGISFYFVGVFTLFFFCYKLLVISDKPIQFIILGVVVALQLWFIYIMSKAIRLKET